VKLKFKLNRRLIAVVAIVLVGLFGLLAHRSTGSGGGTAKLDGAAEQACSDFAAGYSRARTTAARLRLADKVMASSQHSDNDEVAKRAAEMGRSADDGTAAWRAGAGALTKACRDAGWNA
jgi:hypothetical protein